MEEKKNMSYQDYLYEKLDLIFNGENGTVFENNINSNFVTIYDFKDGYAIVEKNEKWQRYNHVDTNGKLISKEWYHEVGNFNEGYALIMNFDKYNFIDSNGNLISEEWYDYAWDFKNGYALVMKDGLYNYIDTKGKLRNDGWLLKVGLELYDKESKFVGGYAIVEKNGKYNYIDTNGKLISEEWYDRVWDFSEGFAVVKKLWNGYARYNFIDTNGKLISEEWYDIAYRFEDGCALVAKDHKVGNPSYNYYEYNFINTNGELINEEWFHSQPEYVNGYSIVEKRGGKFNFVDIHGKLISKEWFDAVENFKKGYAIVQKKGKYYFLDTRGKLIRNKKVLKASSTETPKIDMQDYQVKKTLFGYQCRNSTDKYSVKYQPIKRFGYRYTLCLNKDEIYLYDRVNNSYLPFGYYKQIEYDDNFIFDRNKKHIYLIYEDQMIDVTNYYREKLLYKVNISVSSGVKGILSEGEFNVLNMQERDAFMQEEKRRNQSIKEAQEKARQIEELKQAKKEAEETEREKRKEELEALKQLHQALTTLQGYTTTAGKKHKKRYENIFIKVGDHKEINPIFIKALRFIDLSYETFEDVKLEGIDFSGCNLDNLNPQLVFNKSLRGCNFTGVDFGKLVINPTNFTGVDIRGCTFRFGDVNNKMDLDEMNSTFKHAIYDKDTTFNGESFSEIFNERSLGSK